MIYLEIVDNRLTVKQNILRYIVQVFPGQYKQAYVSITVHLHAMLVYEYMNKYCKLKLAIFMPVTQYIIYTLLGI